MKLLRHIIGVILGIVVFVFVYGLTTLIIQFIGSIPIIGSILYYPSDAAWALIAIPAPTAIFAAAYVSEMIAKTAKPISVIAAIFWILNIISLFVFDTFTWRELLASIFAVGAACICFGGMDDSPGKAKNSKYMVVDKETGEVVDEEYTPKS